MPMRKKKKIQAPSLATRGKNSGFVRIGGGKWKRTPLAVMDLEGLRPTGSRIRETVFDWLNFLLSGFEGRQALDMFAGSGALGLEFASRGGGALLVEKDRRNAALLFKAVEKLQAGGAVEIAPGDAFSVVGAVARKFDVVFIDPPFASGLHEAALELAARVLKEGGLVYYETPSGADPGVPPGWAEVRRGASGAVVYRILARAEREK